MEEKKTKNEKEQKLSYEQLNNVAVQLQQRCAMLENRLRSIDLASMRLNYLLRVVEIKEAFSDDFIAKCSKEIEDMLTPSEETGDAPEIPSTVKD